jgi:dUTPase
MVYPRSSISKYNLALANSVGVIDSGFRNTVKVRFRYIIQPKDIVIKEGNIEGVKIDKEKIYRNGDKIAQIIWCMHNHPFLNFSDVVPPSQRALGGFGSTGR